MPIKWDAPTDQVLLLKILETSAVVPDTKAISAAWPKDMEQPTPRAIAERLVKIRSTIKANGGSAAFSVPSSRTATPQKRAPRGSKTPTSTSKSMANGNGNGGKRKRGKKEESETSDTGESVSKFLNDDDDETSATEIESPSKKVKAAPIKREDTAETGPSIGSANKVRGSITPVTHSVMGNGLGGFSAGVAVGVEDGI